MREDCRHPWSSEQPLRLSWRLLLAVSACCALCLTAAPPARAECGDYVSRGDTRPAHASSPARNAGQTAHHPASPRQGACRGPHCSQGAPTPTIPFPTAPVRTQEWGFLAVLNFGVANQTVAG